MNSHEASTSVQLALYSRNTVMSTQKPTRPPSFTAPHPRAAVLLTSKAIY